MERFSINNLVKPISFEQYLSTGKQLEEKLKEVNSNITSKLLLTTNKEDYNWMKLTVDIPDVNEALQRREEYALEDLNNHLWNQAYQKELYIHDYTKDIPFMVSLTTEDRQPKSLIFYAQALDDASYEVFKSFKKTKGLQRLGDGYGTPSEVIAPSDY